MAESAASSGGRPSMRSSSNVTGISLRDAEKKVRDVRRKQQQWRHLRTQATVRLRHLRRVVESAKRMTFNADLEMARLVRGLEEQGFVVELFSPEQTQDYVVPISGGVGMLRAILD